MTKKRDIRGRFAVTSFSYIDDQGYPRIGTGRLRGMRIHRIVAEAMLGRPLRKDEDVHHINGDKLNFSPENLKVMGHREHGCVSAKQHHYLEERNIQLKHDWDKFMEQEENQ